jgi:hypothetical protein
MYMGIYDAWSAIAENLFENMDIPMSASGTIDDIIACLAPQRRRMNVRKRQDACCIEYRSGSDRVRIESHGDRGMTMAFQPNLPYWAYDLTEMSTIPVETTFDISTYGPDSVAAVIAALFRSHRILLDRFRKYAYR